jgi:malate dehydrogenase (oxaloacetate-decarboxylating)(NADP+)
MITEFYSNMYVFPGIGLGAILCKAVHITQEMVCSHRTSQVRPLTEEQIYTSAVALSTAINTNEINAGRLYPELDRIREVSVIVAREVIREAQQQGLDREKSIRNLSDSELDAFIRSRMYDPRKDTGLHQTEPSNTRSTSSKIRVPGSPSKL